VLAREIHSISSNLLESMRFFGRAHSAGEVCDHPGVSLIFCGLNYAAFNAAILSDTAVAQPADLHRLIQVPVQQFGSRRLRWTYWLCDDYLEPHVRREAKTMFSKFGLHPLTEPPGMFADRLLAPRRALPAVEMRPVIDEPTRLAFAHITSVGFEIPGNVCRQIYGSRQAWSGRFQGFVGYVKGLPVCTAATVVSDNVVGLYSVATLPNQRRRGYAEATMRQALNLARVTTGIEATVLQSTEEGFPLYQQMGYRKLTRFSVYIS
jgi:ribosomal protein S18 acetylase RimI-like enzyme